MSSFFILEGNLVREPETKLVGQKTVIKFSIAENTRTKDANGNYVDGEANYYDINFWTEKPDFWLKRLGKGVTVICRGFMKQDRWEKDGQKFSKINFTATEINAKWLPELNLNSSTPAPASQPAQNTEPVSNSEDTSIPF